MPRQRKVRLELPGPPMPPGLSREFDVTAERAALGDRIYRAVAFDFVEERIKEAQNGLGISRGIVFAHSYSTMAAIFDGSGMVHFMTQFQTAREDSVLLKSQIFTSLLIHVAENEPDGKLPLSFRTWLLEVLVTLVDEYCPQLLKDSEYNPTKGIYGGMILAGETPSEVAEAAKGAPLKAKRKREPKSWNLTSKKRGKASAVAMAPVHSSSQSTVQTNAFHTGLSNSVSESSSTAFAIPQASTETQCVNNVSHDEVPGPQAITSLSPIDSSGHHSVTNTSSPDSDSPSPFAFGVSSFRSSRLSSSDTLVNLSSQVANPTSIVHNPPFNSNDAPQDTSLQTNLDITTQTNSTALHPSFDSKPLVSGPGSLGFQLASAGVASGPSQEAYLNHAADYYPDQQNSFTGARFSPTYPTSASQRVFPITPTYAYPFAGHIAHPHTLPDGTASDYSAKPFITNTISPAYHASNQHDQVFPAHFTYPPGSTHGLHNSSILRFQDGYFPPVSSGPNPPGGPLRGRQISQEPSVNVVRPVPQTFNPTRKRPASPITHHCHTMQKTPRYI